VKLAQISPLNSILLHKAMASYPTSARFGIFCDQVRREDNGKLLMIGVYGHNIGVQKFPVQMGLSLVICLQSHSPADNLPMQVKVTFNGKEIFDGRGTLNVQKAGSELIVLPNIRLSTAEAGDMEAKIKLGNGKWNTMAAISLEKNES
jgi:Family of unknown function (DUF6941)